MANTEDIADLAFIGGKTNREISDKAPIDNLKKILEGPGKIQLEKQAVPTDPELLKPEAFAEFLSQRRELFAKKLNIFIGASAIIPLSLWRKARFIGQLKTVLFSISRTFIK